MSSRKTHISSREGPEGIVLYGNMKVGQQIGQGAVGAVYQLIDNNTNEILSYVAKIVALPPSSAKKKSQEQIKMCGNLNGEALLYKLTFNDGDIVPKLPDRWQHNPKAVSADVQGYRYLVMERMVQGFFSCVDELIESSGKALNVNLAPIAQRLVQLCETVQLKKYFMTDVKPDNIMFASGAGDLAERLRFVDLGLWRKIDKETSVSGSVAQLSGNAMYCSLHMQDLQKPFVRDDVQMIVVIIAELAIRVYAKLHGKTKDYEKNRVPSYLPWSHGKNDSEVFQLKRENLLKRSSEFYKRMPPAAADTIFELVRLTHGLGFVDKPNYEEYTSMLKHFVVPKPVKKKSSPLSASALKAPARAARTKVATSVSVASSSRVTRSSARLVSSGSHRRSRDADDEDSQTMSHKRAAVNDNDMVIDSMVSEGDDEPGGDPMIVDSSTEEQENLQKKNTAGILITVKQDGKELNTISAYPGITYVIGSGAGKNSAKTIHIFAPGIDKRQCEIQVNGVPKRPGQLLSVSFKHVSNNGETDVAGTQLKKNGELKRVMIADIPSPSQPGKKVKMGSIVMEFKQL